jgi:CheY-like chemotaxis protein/c-di-GMP-binding flagellar brake protein YcgR
VASVAKPPAALAAGANRRETEELCRHLAESGWTAFAAEDAQSALDILCAQQVRLGFFALDSPAVDALAVVRHAQARGRRFYCVFLDSADRQALRSQCSKLGALAYLVRPISASSLAHVLQTARSRPLPTDATGDPAADISRILSPGKRLRLSIRAGPAAGSYSAMVLESGPAALALSAWSGEGASPTYVSLGTPIVVGFSAVEGWGEFQANVMGSFVHDDLLHITVPRPTRVIYRQRRSCERFYASLPVRVWLASDDGSEGAAVAGHLDNLSKHGLGAFLRSPLPADMPVKLAVFPALWEPDSRLDARPVWSEPIGRGGKGWHRFGFRFCRLNPKARRNLNALLARVKSREWQDSIEARGSDPVLFGERTPGYRSGS